MLRFRSLPRYLSILALLVGAITTLSGCGKDPLNAAAVKGIVTTDGLPLKTGSVRFVPDKSKGNTVGAEPTGTVSASGEYELITNGKPGAPLGWYQVTVSSGEIPDSSKATSAKPAVAPRFGKVDTSKLSVEVVASPGAGAYDLKVSAK